uniref:Uncharacterized protein n=1 Tax=Chelonoidis abingdonii TaxID=106734 RepID=A0A8C0HJR4_CHEAB
MGQNTLLHGEALFIITTTDPNYYLPFFTKRISSNFSGHPLLIEGTFWQPVAGKEMLIMLPVTSAPHNQAEESPCVLLLKYPLDLKGMCCREQIISYPTFF